MSWFQLAPSDIAERARSASPIASAPSLAASIRRGAIGFTIVSLAGFAPWAFFGRLLYRQTGEAGLYAICAIVFIGLSGLLLHRLIIGPGSLGRFYKLFGLAFTLYSAAWITGWMTLHGNAGGAAGLLGGAILMAWILTTAFEARGALVKTAAALFLLNALGYFVGGWIEAWLIPMKGCSIMGIPLATPTVVMVAKMQWAVCYGAGFGAGLGLAFHLCQARARALLESGGRG